MEKHKNIRQLTLISVLFVLLFVFYGIQSSFKNASISDLAYYNFATPQQTPLISDKLHNIVDEATTVKDLKPEIQCKEGSTDPQCLDKCSTSYTIQQNNKQFKRKSCFWSGAKDPVRLAVERVVKFCQVNSVEQVWKDAGCRDNPAKLTKSGQVKKSGKTNVTGLRYKPKKGYEYECSLMKHKLVEEISKSLSKAKTQKIKGKNNYDECTFYGAVTCMQTEANQDGFTCKPKKSSLGGGDTRTPPTTTPPPSTTPPPGSPDPFSQNFGYSLGKNFGQSFMGRMFQNLFGQGAGQGSSGGSYGHKCDSYYYRIFHKEECTPPKDVICSLTLSSITVERGEPVVVRWDVEYSTEQSLTFDPSLGVDEEYTEQSGEVVIYPENSGYVVLEAVGKGEENTCSKRVNITVLNPSGEGKFPPIVSCAPQFIKSGSPTEVNINWQCRGDSAKYTTSENFSTSGDIEGSSTKTVQDTTEFKVNCYDENDNWLGSNSCTVKAENPLFEIIAYPEEVGRDEKTRISWGSIGMTTCRVDGPNGFSYEAQNAVVITTPFTDENDESEAIFTIQCASKYGGVYSKDLVVKRK